MNELILIVKYSIFSYISFDSLLVYPIVRKYTTKIELGTKLLVIKSGIIENMTIYRLDKIQNFQFNQSILGMMFNYGDFSFHIGDVKIEMKNINQYKQFKNQFTLCQQS